MDDTWAERAACRGMDPNLFHRHSRSTYPQERRICEACDVRLECARFALDNRIEVGLYGGLLPDERRRVLLKRRRTNWKRRQTA